MASFDGLSLSDPRLSDQEWDQLRFDMEQQRQFEEARMIDPYRQHPAYLPIPPGSAPYVMPSDPVGALALSQYDQPPGPFATNQYDQLAGPAPLPTSQYSQAAGPYVTSPSAQGQGQYSREAFDLSSGPPSPEGGSSLPFFSALEAFGAGIQGRMPLGVQVGMLNQQLATRRQAAAQQQAALDQQRQEHMDKQAMEIWMNPNLSLANKKKMSQEVGLRGNALASNLAKLGNEELVGKAELYRPYLTPEQYAKALQILHDPNGDLVEVEQMFKFAQGRHEITKEAEAKATRYSTLLKQFQGGQMDVMSPDFEEFSQYQKERTKREEEAKKLRIELQGLQADVNRKLNKPEEAYTFRTPEGGITTGIYDPRTGKTTNKEGMPLQRVQTQDITAATKTKSMEILDIAENVTGVIQQYRDVLRPENVGLVGDLRSLVFGAGQQADAFSRLLKGQANTVVDQLGQTGASVSVSNFFDPKLSKGELLGNILAYQYAYLNSPDGRVSNEDFKIAQQSLGVEKLLTGAGEIGSRLDALQEVVDRRREIAARRLNKEKGGTGKPRFETIEDYMKARGITPDGK